jgi:hypothetical protein
LGAGTLFLQVGEKGWAHFNGPVIPSAYAFSANTKHDAISVTNGMVADRNK